jgi:DNA-binding XRE family transcriptional regulator
VNLQHVGGRVQLLRGRYRPGRPRLRGPHALRRLRTDRGLSQRRLAPAIGVDPLTVKRLEDGAYAGDLPLHVVGRLVRTLAAPVGRLLRQQETTAAGVDHLTAVAGAALLAHGRTTVTNLATALGATVDDVTAAVTAVDAHLAGAGMSVARHHDDVWLVPLVPRRTPWPPTGR